MYELNGESFNALQVGDIICVRCYECYCIGKIKYKSRAYDLNDFLWFQEMSFTSEPTYTDTDDIIGDCTRIYKGPKQIEILFRSSKKVEIRFE